MSGWGGALAAAVLAVVVFVVGQAFLKFVLEPIQDQRKLIGEVAHALLFHANRGGYGFFPEELNETRDHLRELAGRLRGTLFYIPAYDTLARVGWVPERGKVLAASTHLVGWSNSLNSDDHEAKNRRHAIIAESLNIPKLTDV